MDRVILHCDCNCFFASVETALHPEFKDVPMAVCGSVENRHGIVLAKNEFAKHYGIVTAETVASAKRKCPSLVIASPHFEEYQKYSKMVNDIFYRFTDSVEPFGIDESWLDVTASQKLFGDGMAIAERIRTAVKEEIGITVSIGVSFNKVFAKLGSDYKKPDAITEISKDNFKDIVYPLTVDSMLFVGKKTAQALKTMGIRTIGDLAKVSLPTLVNKFGKQGEILYKYARGEDDSPVVSEREERKSISNGYTFRKDLLGVSECHRAIRFLTEEIGTKLRKNGTLASVVTLRIKDPFFKTFQRQTTLSTPTDHAEDIADAAISLYESMWEADHPVRQFTVCVSSFVEKRESTTQISMFENTVDKMEKNKNKDMAIDEIRQKFGGSSIVPALRLSDEFGIFDK